MNYNEFLEEILERMQAHYGESTRVSINKVRKNNGIVLDGLAIMEDGKSISPTIYLNDFYEQYGSGMEIGEITEEIIHMYENSICRELDFSYFADFENIRGRIVYKLINKAANEELLKTVPYDDFLDLAICYGVYVRTDQFGNGMMLIQNHHMKMWGVNQEVLKKEAGKNTPELLKPHFTTMFDILNEILFSKKTNEDYSDSPLFVLTNSEKFFGAGCILYEGMLKQISKTLGGDLYILPSSTSEVIILRKDGEFTKEKLVEMVKGVNDEMVCREEILSYSVYEYDAKDDIIHL